MDGIDIVVKVFDHSKRWHENYEGESLYQIPGCSVQGNDLNEARIFVHQFASKAFHHGGTDSLDFPAAAGRVFVGKIIIVWVDGPSEELEDLVSALAEKFGKEAPVEV